jgi:hypothetical protein
MITQLYHNLVKIYSQILAQVQNYQLHLTQNSSKYFDYSIQQYNIEVFPIKTMEKKSKGRQGVEGKTRS